MRTIVKVFNLTKRFILLFIHLFLAKKPTHADVMKLIPLLAQSLGATESQA
jgi:hypothetical protein